ncbi:MAG: Rha family transcriptional regulator [Deltaproteobacteria bacterium]|nr:Rha family transcriptional regulator [Deltaproteobacteria bacterium]
MTNQEQQTITPKFRNYDRVTVTSLEIADKFGKRHKDVLETIRKKFDPEKFLLVEDAGRKHYRMNRDGFLFLAHSFRKTDAICDKISMFTNWFDKMRFKNLKAELDNCPVAPVPDNHGCPVTDFGYHQERPWLAAETLHRELYKRLESKYEETGVRLNRTTMALRKSMFYEAEEFAVLLDYLIMKAPRYTEAILKLQLAALDNAR